MRKIIPCFEISTWCNIPPLNNAISQADVMFIKLPLYVFENITIRDKILKTNRVDGVGVTNLKIRHRVVDKVIT